MNEIKLTDDQCQGLLKLINAEMEENAANEDDAYNTYWTNIKTALGYVD